MDNNYVKKEDPTSLSQIAAIAAEHDEKMLLVLAEEVKYGPDGVRGLVGPKYVFCTAFLVSLDGSLLDTTRESFL